jgi:hypothetical protein
MTGRMTGVLLTEKPTTCGGRAFDELNIVLVHTGAIVTSQLMQYYCFDDET